MARNLKALGLALVAVFAMSAVAASAAQAQATVTTTEPAWLTFDSLGTQDFTVTAGAITSTVSCTTVDGHATVKNGDTTITATGLTYTNCTTKLGASTLPTTVNMTGCDYKFHGGKTTVGEPDHIESIEVDLICGEGITGPDITIYQNAAEHTANKPLCTVTTSTFVNRTGITTLNTVTTVGPPHIPNDFDLNANGVTVPVKVEGSLLCPTKATSGGYTGKITVTGFKDEGTNADGSPKEGARLGVTIS